MSLQSNQLNQKILAGFSETITDKGTRQILINAIDVFARKGLAGTKIKDIAQKAGFSQGFIYNYFCSKEEIFIKIVDLAADGAAAMVKNAAELPGTAYQKIYWLTEALLDPQSVVMQHWRLIMLQVATSDAVPEAAKQLSEIKMKKPFELFIPMLIDGQNNGTIVQTDPLVLAITYFSFIQGLGITRVQGGPDIPFPSIELILSFLRR